MGITTKDLAALCGVSRATVTRALHGTGRIREETKQLILETAQKYDYSPDLVARSLVSGRSMTIGVVVVDLNNQYFPKIVDAIARRALQDDYVLNITVHEDDKKMEQKLIRAQISHHVDGLILSPINKGQDFYRMMERVEIPYCVLNLDEFDDVPGVGLDEQEAGYDAGEYMIAHGCSRLAFVAPTLYDRDGIQNMGHHRRRDGVLRAAEKHGAPCRVISDSLPEDYLPRVLDFLRDNTPGRPGILCSGAIFAVRVIGFLRQQGIEAPRDYGLMTFDNLEMLKTMPPRLTCVDNHAEKIGIEAGNLILRLLRGEKTENHILIQHDIIEGDTL